MKAQEDKYDYGIGIFPTWTAINSSGPGIADGSPYLAGNISDGWEGVSQAIMHYASGLQKINDPTGSIGVPNGITEATGISQVLQAMQKAHGIGPGNFVPWGNYDSPSITGDRVILLAGQGVLIADYPGLDEACYVGDANNTDVFNAKGKFYRSSDSAGTIPNIAGPYLQLPDQPGDHYFRFYSQANGDFTVTGPSWVTVKAEITVFRSNNQYLGFITINGNVPSAARTSYAITISGVSWVTNEALSGRSNAALVGAKTLASNTIIFEHETASPSNYTVNGIVRFLEYPTFATSYEFEWGIRY